MSRKLYNIFASLCYAMPLIGAVHVWLTPTNSLLFKLATIPFVGTIELVLLVLLFDGFDNDYDQDFNKFE